MPDLGGETGLEPEVAVSQRRPGRLGKEDQSLTVCIMNRNQRARLPRSLRSALDAAGYLREQGFGAEVLVLDEGSRDGSQKLLRTVQALYGEPRLRVLELERQLPDGASLRNLALETSASRYVYMLEAGDELLPGNLPLLLRSAIDTRAAMIYGNLLDRQDGSVSDVRSNMPATLRLMRTNYVDACSIVDARRLLKMGGYAEIHPQAPEGWEMILHLISEEELIVFVPVVAGYRYEDSSVEPSKEAVAALQSVHAQTGARDWDSVKVGRIYHPHVGFVEE